MTFHKLIGSLAVFAMATTATVAIAAPDGQMGQHRGMGPRAAMMDFDAIDSDGDGKITAAEIKAHADQRFATADTNGDGFVDAAEMQVRMMAQAAARMEQRSARMVAAMDKDGDGKLSAEEMRAGPRAGRGANSQDRLARMMTRLDRDGDGAISREEMDEARAAWSKRASHRGEKAD